MNASNSAKAEATKSSIVEDNLKFRYTIIDMHTIDCEKFLTMDSPDALVLAILCDFKGRDERDMKLEELPSYQIAIERNKDKWVSQGISQGIISSAIKMITKFKLSIEEVAKELNISIDELKKHIDKP